MFKQVIAVAALLVAGSAQAATSFDVVARFNTANSPFSFGSGTGGGFTAAPNFVADNCVGFAGLACYNTPGADYTFPAIGKNVSASDPLMFATNVLPQNTLFLQSLPGATATVRFTAPVTTTYTFTGAFTRIDSSNGSGDGVTVSFLGNAPVALGTTYLNSASIGQSLTLAAGTSVDFSVDALSNTFNDGTGLQLAVGYVPEPATWAMMIGGFGLVGGALRSRRRNIAAAAA